MSNISELALGSQPGYSPVYSTSHPISSNTEPTVVETSFIPLSKELRCKLFVINSPSAIITLAIDDEVSTKLAIVKLIL